MCGARYMLCCEWLVVYLIYAALKIDSLEYHTCVTHKYANILNTMFIHDRNFCLQFHETPDAFSDQYPQRWRFRVAGSGKILLSPMPRSRMKRWWSRHVGFVVCLNKPLLQPMVRCNHVRATIALQYMLQVQSGKEAHILCYIFIIDFIQIEICSTSCS